MGDRKKHNTTQHNTTHQVSEHHGVHEDDDSLRCNASQHCVCTPIGDPRGSSYAARGSWTQGLVHPVGLIRPADVAMEDGSANPCMPGPKADPDSSGIYGGPLSRGRAIVGLKDLLQN